jgi:hypothetical protein
MDEASTPDGYYSILNTGDYTSAFKLDTNFLIANGLLGTTAETDSREIFVGYPYAIPQDDYRTVFKDIATEFGVTFIFADEQLTNRHILEKITGMMGAVAFSLFDITYWNPNVALELGIAYGRQFDYYILFDPTKDKSNVLSDLQGIDRIEYSSYTELRSKLAKLMRDQFGAPEQEETPEAAALVEQIETLRARVPELLTHEPGQPVGGIASSLGVPIEIAQTIIRPLVGSALETRGTKRGMRYYAAGQAPPEDEQQLTEDDRLPLSLDDV